MNTKRSNSFLSDKENEIGSKYLEKGYIIGPAHDKSALDWMRKSFIRVSKEELNITQDTLDDKFLDLIHKKLAISELNDFRLSMIPARSMLPF